jgi:hypothetical protein
MRVRQGRGDWRAGSRIDGLLRYAFLGDSHTFGAGVAPDQTLAAHFERQANETLRAWPVEAVNLGISGYNLWNSWLAFRQVPPVFDGVVLTLCNNDADLFGRTLRVQYPQTYDLRWDSEHPFGEAVARCFDEIALFSREHAVPVAVVYSSTSRHHARVGEIIAGLCAPRGFCFIDTYAHYRDRNFADSDLTASSADFHPSAMAHDAIGRYLLATLRQIGWFEKYSDVRVDVVPDRIVAAAVSMVQTDRYPPDAALNWALRTLQAKSRLAHRLEASGSCGREFAAAADHCRQTLATASRRWHMANRLRAFIESIPFGVHDLAWILYCSENERSKLEEIRFALQSGDWNRLSMHSLEPGPQLKAVAGEVSDMRGFLDRISQDIQNLYCELQCFRAFAAPAEIGSSYDEPRMLADIELLEKLAARVQVECEDAKSIVLRIEDTFLDAGPELTEAGRARVSGLIDGAFMQIKRAFEVVARWPALLRGLCEAKAASFTTIEVTLCAGPLEGKPPNCLLTLQAEYAVPFRLAFNDSGAFWPDGSQFLVKLHVPLLYAGRVVITASNPRAANDPMVGFEILKVELYNHEHRRRVIYPASFWRDPNGRFISPIVYLV